MPVLSIGEIKYMITLHKKISYNSFLTKFWIGKFFRQFWENLEEIRFGTVAEIRPKSGPKKHWSHLPNMCIISIIPYNVKILHRKSTRNSCGTLLTWINGCLWRRDIKVWYISKRMLRGKKRGWGDVFRDKHLTMVIDEDKAFNLTLLFPLYLLTFDITGIIFCIELLIYISTKWSRCVCVCMWRYCLVGVKLRER